MDQRWWQIEGPDAWKTFKGEFLTSKKVTVQGTIKAPARPGGNSGAGAVLLAGYYGAKKIALLGCDGKYDANKKRHWHGDHKKGLGNAVSVPKFADQFKEAASFLEKTGAPLVINCSPDSAIDFWPKMTISEALCLKI